VKEMGLGSSRMAGTVGLELELSPHLLKRMDDRRFGIEITALSNLSASALDRVRRRLGLRTVMPADLAPVRAA
jgi:FMN phosphatase YigB (HAD superfamily)